MVTAGNRTELTGLRTFRELPSISILYCNFCRQVKASPFPNLHSRLLWSQEKKEKWRREEGRISPLKKHFEKFLPQGLNAKWAGRAIHPAELY